ncbi:hypothetical protein FPOA_09140 [Fusarium poae]|uniref:Fungal N-terminal domain-containing protein n=1 Tax=Fusarium poae TaxID=36050 RepID=A0A1B8AR34_FUSPO|nr:hypothetical protein FPOA_09140 [Fusarium poae]
MSDPLSVAGTAVGITSLGIQVCQGLITYLRAVRGRKEEIRDIVREVDQVVSLLYSLHNTLPDVGIRNGANSLRTCVNNCYTKLEELGKILDDLSESQHPQKVVKRAADIMRGMSYPFQQEKLNTMRQSLRSILGDLGLVISIISMDCDFSIENTVNDISQNVKYNAASHLAYSKDLQTQMHCNSIQLRTLQTTISNTLRDIQDQLHQTQLSIQDLGQQINGTMTVFETGQRSIEANTQVTAAKMDELMQVMQSHSVLLQSMILFTLIIIRFVTTRTMLPNERLVYAFTSCIRTLLQANDCDLGSPSIAMRLIDRTNFTTSEYDITKYLISFVSETSLFTFTDNIVLGIAKFKPSASFTSIIHGALELSPVAKAILSRNFEDLVSCVRQAPESVLECVFGVDAVLLSVAWPKGLKYLLTTKATTLLSLDDKEYRGQHLLRAVDTGPAESVHLLLQAGCYVPYEEHIRYIPRETARVMASHIAKRRIHLLKSAQTQLGLFIGQESVVFADFAAAKICDAFDTANIPVNPCLRVKPSYKSIYLNRDVPLHAFKEFWREGFRYFNCHDCVGRTPIMATKSLWKYTHWKYPQIDENFQYTKEIISWLCKHGFMQGKAKDPLSLGFNVFSNGYHYTGASLASYAKNAYWELAKCFRIVRFLAELTENSNTEDNCTCWCNERGRGCSPTKLFLKPFFLHGTYPENFAEKGLARILHCQTFHGSGSDELSALAKDALRLLTFEALDMTHTCCYFDRIGEHDPCNLASQDLHNDWAIFCRDSESVLEIRSSTEEQTSAVLLEELMIEFIPQLQLFNPSPLAFEGFISTYFRRRISQLYSQYSTVVDDLHQYQVFQGFGSSPPLEARVLPESVHRLLGKYFQLLGPNESISEEECLAEVTKYMGLQCNECLFIKSKKD